VNQARPNEEDLNHLTQSSLNFQQSAIRHDQNDGVSHDLCHSFAKQMKPKELNLSANNLYSSQLYSETHPPPFIFPQTEIT